MATGNQALLLELARAKSQPSRAYRSLSTALEGVQGGLEGYLQGNQIAGAINENKRQNQTLSEALGGNVPSRLYGYESLPVRTAKDLGGLDAISKLTEPFNSNGDYLTTEQAKQYGLPDSFISSFGGKPIRREVAQGFVGNQSRGRIAGSLEKRSELQVANSINRNVNTLTSGTGALALAGKNNLRIARVKSLLERPTPLTPQELELVTTDLAGIVQGGVPLKDTVEGQAIGTAATRLADLLKQITNNPQTFNDMGFRRRIIQLSNEMIAADNEVQNKALAMVKANYGHLTTPEHLARIEQAIREGQQLPVLEPGAAATQDLSSMSTEELNRIAYGVSE